MKTFKRQISGPTVTDKQCLKKSARWGPYYRVCQKTAVLFWRGYKTVRLSMMYQSLVTSSENRTRKLKYSTIMILWCVPRHWKVILLKKDNLEYSYAVSKQKVWDYYDCAPSPESRIHKDKRKWDRNAVLAKPWNENLCPDKNPLLLIGGLWRKNIVQQSEVKSSAVRVAFGWGNIQVSTFVWERRGKH